MSRTLSRATVWALGIAVVAALLSAVLGALAFQAESRRRGAVVAARVDTLVAAHRVVALSERRAHLAREVLLTGSPSARRQREAAIAEFHRMLERLEGAAESPGGVALIARIRDQHQALNDAWERLVTAKAAGLPMDELLRLFDADIVPVRSAVDVELESLVVRKQGRVDQALAEAERARRVALSSFLAFTPVALGILGVLGARVVRLARARERDRQRAAEHLRDSEARLRRLFDTHLLGFVFWTADRRLTEVNDAFLRMIHYTRADVGAGGLPWEELTPPEWKAQDEELVAELTRTGQHRLAEKEYFRKDGTRVPVMVAATAFPGTRAEGVGFVLDLTERKQVERQMRETAAALSESEARFQALADNMSQLAWMANPDGDIFWFNRRWYEYTGTTFEQMAARGWRKVHDPAHLGRVEARFQTAIDAGTVWEDTFPLRRYDGQYRWHLSRAMPMRDATGRILAWFGTNTDIEDERRHATELREALRAREVFISVAAHELKTPMTSLLLRLAQLRAEAQREGDGDPALERRLRSLDVAQGQVRRLARLVEGLLDVSRMSDARYTLALDELDLVALVNGVVREMAPDAGRQESTLHVETPDYLIGQFDRMKVEQVLVNLLSNAVKFGAGKPIRVVVEKAGERARLIVEDQGIGIAPEFMDRIFNRFERGVSDRHYGGFGLGLYVTRQLVEGTGGTIRAESEPGRGARFIVELPVRVEPLAPVKSVAS